MRMEKTGEKYQDGMPLEMAPKKSQPKTVPGQDGQGGHNPLVERIEKFPLKSGFWTKKPKGGQC